MTKDYWIYAEHDHPWYGPQVLRIVDTTSKAQAVEQLRAYAKRLYACERFTLQINGRTVTMGSAEDIINALA